MKSKIESIRTEVLKLIQEGKEQKDIISYITNTADVKSRAAKDWLKKFAVPVVDEPLIVKSKDVTSLEELLTVCKVDTNKYEISKFNVKKGNVILKNGDVQTDVPRFEVEAFLTKKDQSGPIIEELKADLKAYSPKPMDNVYVKDPEGMLLVVSVFDAHLGKLSWAEESGDSYDLKIARKIYFKALYNLVAKAKRQGPINRIVFPIGNDYLTCDTNSNTTTAGTPQDVDSRFPKIFREGRKILVESINYLKELAPVDVIVVPGNHDRSSMFHLGDSLECWYHNDPNVTVDNVANVRKYYSYGNNFFGLTHGDKIKQDKLPLIGATERPDLWAKCKNRIWLLGHYHHYQVKEYTGVTVWILPSISGSDSFHHTNGYVGSSRCALAFLYSKKGLEAILQSDKEN